MAIYLARRSDLWRSSKTDFLSPESVRISAPVLTLLLLSYVLLFWATAATEAAPERTYWSETIANMDVKLEVSHITLIDRDFFN